VARAPSITVAAIVAFAVVMGVAWGWHAAVVFGFLAGLALALWLGVAQGGELIQQWSRRRFEDDHHTCPRRRD
jgi:hypothetical protein